MSCLVGAEGPGNRAAPVTSTDDGGPTEGPGAPELPGVHRTESEVGGVREAGREHEDPVPLHGSLLSLQVQGHAVLRSRSQPLVVPLFCLVFDEV